MHMGEPLAQIFAVANGFVVMVPNEKAEEAAEKAAEKAAKNGQPAPYVPSDEKQTKLVFADMKAVVKFLAKELPGLAKDTKGDFDAAFDEAD